MMRIRNTGRSGLGILCVALLLNGCTAGTFASGTSSYSADIEVSLQPLQTFGGSGGAALDLSGRPYEPGFVSGVAASGGYLFLIDGTLPGLLRVDMVSREARVLRPLGDATTPGLYVRPDLVIYVVDRYNRAVVELDESGHERHIFRETHLVASPVDVAVTSWGSSIVVADELTQRLIVFESFSTLMATLPSAMSAVSVASSIGAISATRDHVFVLDTALREVTQLDLYGRAVATYGEDSLLTPVAMVVDECHRIFVADGHPDGLLVTSPDSLGSISRAQLPREIASQVTDLWIDGGELYVAAGTAGVWVLSINPGCFES